MQLSNRKRNIILAIALLCVGFLLVRPVTIEKSTSTVLYDRNQQLLAATVSSDEMWRFPQSDSVPYKFRTCILQFEDAYFYYHFGVNPVSVVRAFWQNFRSDKVVSGASTITMQLVRLSRNGKPRKYSQKLIEMIVAIRTELAYSKDEILSMYVSNAPFGGNVVGVDAAAWRYFGTSVANLSWAEAAALAVLPNAPGLVFPGRNQQELLAKRNRLLLKLKNEGYIDQETCSLSLLEPAPNPANVLPQEAIHLLTRCIRDGFKGKSIVSTINSDIQREVQQIVLRHYPRLEANGIHNMAVMVTDNYNGEALAYVGNVQSNNPARASNVDVICAKRSYGSLLKPFLYGFMLTEGILLPRELVDDIPTAFSGFTPENFNHSFDGVVGANEVISRSLNVPAVNLLQKYGVEKFCNNLNRIGFTSISKSPDYYGLSIILGGAEASMVEIAGAYSALSRKAQGIMCAKTNIHYTLDTAVCSPKFFDSPNISVGAAYLTLEALTQAIRPDENGLSRSFFSTQKIAWKTGTSRGFRDAWAVGVTPKYTVSVWVGNADGEGRAGLVGISAAAPVMFDVFAMLPSSNWYQKPIYDLQTVAICKQSGLLSTSDCPDAVEQDIPFSANKPMPCSYHHKIFIDKNGQRVTLSCAKPDEIIEKYWFVLPPVQEWYYARIHQDYRRLPQFREGCFESSSTVQNIALIYPYAGADIYLPRGAKGMREESIWRATHRDKNATIYWHLNDTFLGQTTGRHEISISPAQGEYILTLVDSHGEIFKRKIRILGD